MSGLSDKPVSSGPAAPAGAPLVVAIDAMGGDHAPAEILKGVAESVTEAAERGEEIRFLVVGRREAIAPFGLPEDRVEIVHAEHAIGMEDSPTARDTGSSIAVGIALVRDGRADAFVSAGNTGAFMTQAVLNLKRLDGVLRPAIPTTIPLAADRFAVLIDAGATADCKPEHVAQFAAMGATYARLVLGIASPRVALLSNGSEKKKGNKLTKETGELLEGAGLDYVGYVEGNSLFEGRADVVACDGFLGNVALKLCEGMAMRVLHMVREEFARGAVPPEAAGAILQSVARRIDYMEYGGAPLLGVRGNLIKCHGASKARAVRNAVRRVGEFVRAGLNDAIERDLKTLLARVAPRSEGA